MMNTDIKNKTVFVAGGTGSWGRTLIERLLSLSVKSIIVYSRNESVQVKMKRELNDDRILFLLGDIRDEIRLNYVFNKYDVDIVFHLAAIKHVNNCEYQQDEAFKTNVIGTQNLIEVAGKTNVEKFIYLSTDKAVYPVNFYGVTKAMAERFVIKANLDYRETSFLIVRAGNVLGSSGSLIPFLIEKIKTGQSLPITDKRMTRYFITLERAIDLLLFAADEGQKGEIYLPVMASFSVNQIFEFFQDRYSNVTIKETGIQEGEKLHESICTIEEFSRIHQINERYSVVYPELKGIGRNFHIWDQLEFTMPVNINISSSYVTTSTYEIENLLKDGGWLL
jgi:UDP-N-acetylglucosamine 4,6-dehydratase/5-epimerase